MFTISEMFKKIHYGGSQYEKLKTGRKQECDLNLVFRTPEDIRYLPYTCCGMGCSFRIFPLPPPPTSSCTREIILGKHQIFRFCQGNIKYVDFVREISNMQILLGKHQICRFFQGNIKYVDFIREISNIQILLGKHELCRIYYREISNIQILLVQFQICRFR